MSPALTLCALATVATAPFLPAVEDFLRDGDRVVFLGDSITEQRLHTTFIEAYALTRHPAWKLQFRNAGWSGDTAFFRSRCHGDGGRLMTADENARAPLIDEILHRGLERDVFFFRPTLVTIDLGMNDAFITPTERMLPVYDQCMTAMSRMIQAGGARLALLSPQPIELRSADPVREDANKALRRITDCLPGIAERTGAVFVDQFDPYATILGRERAAHPNDNIGGGDAVHPGAVGQTLMAWAILKGLGATPLVSRAVVDVPAAAVTESAACSVTNLTVTATAIAFDRLDEALTLPIHPNAAPALTLAPVLDDLSRYEFRFDGLAGGSWQLTIDNAPVATRSAAEWAAGCNLSACASPVTTQGQAVLQEITRKNDLYFTLWRNVQLASFPDWAKGPDLEGRRSAEVERLTRLVAESEAKLDTLRKPVPHHMVLTRTTP